MQNIGAERAEFVVGGRESETIHGGLTLGENVRHQLPRERKGATTSREGEEDRGGFVLRVTSSEHDGVNTARLNRVGSHSATR